MTPFAPGAVIGILGGGQLGRMTALAAARLGYRCHVFAPEPESPAAEVAAAWTRADWRDAAALDRFAAEVDVATLEFENVPTAALARLAARIPCRPGAQVLEVTQDRLAEKGFVDALGLPTTRWRRVTSARELALTRRDLGDRCILKTTRLGYDGKGQVALAADADAAAAWTAFGAGEGILEAFVDFRLELSVITARGGDGAVASYPPVENRHREHVLARTVAPAPIDGVLAREAVAMAEAIARALDLTGLLAVEMFLDRAGRLLVNELAPRPHNSGHWTIDACAVSQFEQLVRAVCGLPLGDPGRFADAEMENLLGDDAARWPEILREPGARLHLYGKREARPGRKMGHVTRLTRLLGDAPSLPPLRR
ncbi:MAG TPA: 5-(carboxyamino)imidazole ribonucleotide synthase [Geminicoccaceae bacterium]|nr:5-(carboxyamino)imidazole ribonucleotide synthase [Geminicoccaceae bacterium]